MEAVQEGMALASCSADLGLVVDCLNQMNEIFNTKSKYRGMERTARLSLTMSQKVGYLKGMASSHNYIGIAFDNSGRYHQAIGHYIQAADIHRRLGNIDGQVTSLENIGVAHYSLGELDQAERRYREALRISQEGGTLRARALLLMCISSVKLVRGEYGEAMDLLKQSLAINEKIGEQGNRAYSLHEIGYLHHAMGNDELALQCLRESERAKEAIGDQWGQVTSINQLARILTESGSTEEASGWLDKGDRLAQSVGSPDLFCRLAVARGMLALAKGDIDSAVAAKDRAIDQANKAMLKTGRAEALLMWARIDDARGFNGSADSRYREARELFAGMNNRLDLGIVDYYRGMNRRNAGLESEAEELLGAAVEAFRSVGAAGWLRRAEEALSEPEQRNEFGESE